MDSSKKLACCGLDCSTCPNIEATKTGDKDYFENVAKSIGERYNKTIDPNDLPCEGCMTDGIKSRYTLACSIRKCNLSKGTKNCAHCVEYLCESMKNMLEKCPKELHDNLEQERHKISKK